MMILKGFYDFGHGHDYVISVLLVQRHETLYRVWLCVCVWGGGVQCVGVCVGLVGGGVCGVCVCVCQWGGGVCGGVGV